MFTAIVYRPSHEEWRNGHQECSSESRMEIVYNLDFESFKDQLHDVMRSFTKDVLSQDAWSPDVELLYKGQPFFEVESEDDNYDLMLELSRGIEPFMEDYRSELRREAAVAANEARLERERQQRASQERLERQELARLEAKYK